MANRKGLVRLASIAVVALGMLSGAKSFAYEYLVMPGSACQIDSSYSFYNDGDDWDRWTGRFMCRDNATCVVICPIPRISTAANGINKLTVRLGSTYAGDWNDVKIITADSDVYDTVSRDPGYQYYPGIQNPDLVFNSSDWDSLSYADADSGSSVLMVTLTNTQRVLWYTIEY